MEKFWVKPLPSLANIVTVKGLIGQSKSFWRCGSAIHPSTA